MSATADKTERQLSEEARHMTEWIRDFTCKLNELVKRIATASSQKPNKGPLFSQQRGDPDFTLAELEQKLIDYFFTETTKFISQFWNQLADIGEVDLFRWRCLNSSAIDSYAAMVNKKLDQSRQHRYVVRNRRYVAMATLESGGYFSEDRMRERDPLLYEHMVGGFRFDRKRALFAHGSVSLSSFVVDFCEREMYEDRVKSQLLAPNPADASRAILEMEDLEDEASCFAAFKRTMQQRFIDGYDGDFDYSTVDGDLSLDYNLIMDADEEEKYFDAD